MKQTASFSAGVWQIYCNTCQHKTNHLCRLDEFSFGHLDEDQKKNMDDYFVEVDGLRLWSCAGCDEWTIEKYWSVVLVEEWDALTDRERIESKFFPERTMFHAQLKQFHQLPATLDQIYREVLHSYNSALSVLCAVGVRTILEGICADQEIQGKNLYEKIEGLSSVLPKNIVTNLHSLRFLGNEAAHEQVSPDQIELQLAINLIEDLLNFLYELDYRAASLTRWREKKRGNDKNVPAEPDEDTGHLPLDADNE